jgi:hypothetical protein
MAHLLSSTTLFAYPLSSTFDPQISQITQIVENYSLLYSFCMAYANAVSLSPVYLIPNY